MELKGLIKRIGTTKEYGEKGFRKRNLVIETDEGQYPQTLLIEFVQDKVSVLDKFKVDEMVIVAINIRGTTWQKTPKDELKYFTTLNGWMIKKDESAVVESDSGLDDGSSGLPF